MFIAAIFTIATAWKSPRCPLRDELIKKLWYIYAIEYYLVIKRNECESTVVRWMNIQAVIQSKVSQKETNRYSILKHIFRICKNGTDEPIFREGMETQT